jgi:hypothetical protein
VIGAEVVVPEPVTGEDVPDAGLAPPQLRCVKAYAVVFPQLRLGEGAAVLLNEDIEVLETPAPAATPASASLRLISN